MRVLDFLILLFVLFLDSNLKKNKIIYIYVHRKEKLLETKGGEFVFILDASDDLSFHAALFDVSNFTSRSKKGHFFILADFKDRKVKEKNCKQQQQNL